MPRLKGALSCGYMVLVRLGSSQPKFSRVSLVPPYVSFCPARTSSSWPTIRSTGRLSINVLTAAQHRVTCCPPAGLVTDPTQWQQP